MIDIDSLPDRLQSEMSVSGCASDQDLASSTPPLLPQGSTAAGKSNGQNKMFSSGIQSPQLEGASDPETNLPIAERKGIQVLVVEDK